MQEYKITPAFICSEDYKIKKFSLCPLAVFLPAVPRAAALDQISYLPL